MLKLSSHEPGTPEGHADAAAEELRGRTRGICPG